MLTICIPTFNRGNSLRTRLLELVPQLQDDVSVLVIDNASEPPSRHAVQDILDANPQITVHENKWNVGMSANIARCLELPSSAWVWLLGDDDSVRENAVGQVLADIAAAESDVVAIKYSSYCGSNPFRESVDLRGFLGRQSRGFGYVANSFLISSTVIRVERIKSFDSVMDSLNCMIPHVIAILELLSRGGRLMLSTTELVRTTGGKTSWSPLRLEANLPRAPLFASGFNDQEVVSMVRFFSNHIHFSPAKLFLLAHKAARNGRAGARFAYALAIFGDFKTLSRLGVAIVNLPFYLLFILRADRLLPQVLRIVGGRAVSRYERFMR